MKVPTSIKIYAGLAFLTAFWAAWRAGYIVVAGVVGQHPVRLVFELVWAAFNVALGIGILRLRPAWRVVALVCCYWVFAIFGLMLVLWCMWPQRVPWQVVLMMLLAVCINGFFFYRLRQPDIKVLFQSESDDSKVLSN